MMKRCLPAVVLTVSLAHAADPDFVSYWHDGQAELNGYRITVSRYGQPRQGYAVAIYVTEPFSESKRVKVNDPARHPGDVAEVLKLNLVRDFQTGVYDYNTMVSVFVRSADFTPVKTTFTSAEWCGQVYEELVFHAARLDRRCFSYFEGESGQQTLAHPRGGVTEDALWILLRGLRGPWLAPGEKRTVEFLPGTYFGRLTHQPPRWTTAEINRAPGAEIRYTVRIADGRIGRFWIDSEYPHRIRRWELPPDLAAELVGSVRVQYWTLNQNGHESYLKDLGLPPPGK